MAFTCTAVSKVYPAPRGDVTALARLTLTVNDHEFVCLVGPSGCGKTTLLKIVAGIIQPSTGAVEFGNSSAERGLQTGLVFQEHGLFPWMDVLDNVAFGLETQGVDRRRRRQAADELVTRLGLGRFSGAYPHQLSGGMRQRVGIARAILADPQVLLMDEPFGALDAQTKLVLQEELLQVWGENRKEVLYVTHDIDEAVRLADRIVVMSGSPGSIIADIDVTIPRPRDVSLRDDPLARELRWMIWDLLKDDARQSAASG